MEEIENRNKEFVCSNKVRGHTHFKVNLLRNDV